MKNFYLIKIDVDAVVIQFHHSSSFIPFPFLVHINSESIQQSNFEQKHSCLIPSFFQPKKNDISISEVGRAVTRSSLEQMVWSSHFARVKSDTVLPTARRRCDISSKEAMLLGAATRRWVPPTRYTLQRNTTSIMKDLIWFQNLYVHGIFFKPFHSFVNCSFLMTMIISLKFVKFFGLLYLLHSKHYLQSSLIENFKATAIMA